MSQPTPPPYGQQPPQPGYGYPHQPAPPYQQPYTGPAPYQPPPVPKKHMSGWAITGFTFLGLIVSLFVLGAVLVAIEGPSSSGAKKPTSVAAAPETPAEADAKPAEKKATPSPKAPAKKPTPPKPKAVEYPDGDYVVGEDIPAGTYETPGAQKGLFEFCSITSDPADDSKFPLLKSANADERIIVTLTKADGVVSVSGCEPLKARR